MIANFIDNSSLGFAKKRNILDDYFQLRNSPLRAAEIALRPFNETKQSTWYSYEFYNKTIVQEMPVGNSSLAI